MDTPPFKFKPFVDDKNHCAQLQEWADYYKVTLKWGDVRETSGKTSTWSSYPIIQGYEYKEFIATGCSGLRVAHNEAAKQIIESPGSLDEAKSKEPVIIAHI